jgi:hypothetical protein
MQTHQAGKRHKLPFAPGLQDLRKRPAALSWFVAADALAWSPMGRSESNSQYLPIAAPDGVEPDGLPFMRIAFR